MLNKLLTKISASSCGYTINKLYLNLFIQEII